MFLQNSWKYSAAKFLDYLVINLVGNGKADMRSYVDTYLKIFNVEEQTVQLANHIAM